MTSSLPPRSKELSQGYKPACFLSKKISLSPIPGLSQGNNSRTITKYTRTEFIPLRYEAVNVTECNSESRINLYYCAPGWARWNSFRNLRYLDISITNFEGTSYLLHSKFTNNLWNQALNISFSYKKNLISSKAVRWWYIFPFGKLKTV